MRVKKRRFGHLPPTAVKISSSDIWAGFKGYVNQREVLDEFRAEIVMDTGIEECFLVSSGRAGLSLILTSLSRLSPRKDVIVPAYVCPTVVQAVLKAGLNPLFCDVSPKTLFFDQDCLDQLLERDLLAVIPAHLYGWALDVEELISTGRRHDFYVIEDAAQAFGAKIFGRMVGTFGDAGCYSLGSGKCIPVGHGGVVIAQNETIANCIEEVSKEVLNSSEQIDFRSLARFIGYAMATNPTGWRIIMQSPLNPAYAGMQLDELEDITLGKLSAVQAGIGKSILERLNDIQDIGRSNARILMEIIEGYEFADVPFIHPEAEPVFLRLPVIIDNEEICNRLFHELTSLGIGVSRSYSRTLPELFSSILPGGNNGYSGAEKLATCLITLPTHAYIREEDLLKIDVAFQTVARRY